MKKFKSILLTSVLIVCALCVSLSFAGCRKKIDNADIQLVLKGVTGDYVEYKYPFTELEPEGFLKAYIVNDNTYVIKTKEIWSGTPTFEIYSAIRGDRYINIVATKCEGSTKSDEDLKNLQNKLNTLKNNEVSFNLMDMFGPYDYNNPKAINAHYNIYNFIKANVKYEIENNIVSNEISQLVETNQVRYKNEILSSVNENNKTYVIAKTTPLNDKATADEHYGMTHYCSITLYVTFDENKEVEDYKILEIYCSPNATSYKTPEQIEKILGLKDFEANRDNPNVSSGTLTAGAVWYALRAAQTFVKNGAL